MRHEHNKIIETGKIGQAKTFVGTFDGICKNLTEETPIIAGGTEHDSIAPIPSKSTKPA